MVDKLDVEDEEQRQQRVQNLLESLNASRPTRPEPPTPQFDFGDRTTFPVPPSALLARVQEFLPQLQAANETLAQQQEDDPDAVDIENVPEDATQYIEMSLGLGLFEDKSKRSKSDSEDDDDDLTSSSGSESDDEAASDSDSASPMDIIASLVPRPVKSLPKRSQEKPDIIVLDEQPETSEGTQHQ